VDQLKECTPDCNFTFPSCKAARWRSGLGLTLEGDKRILFDASYDLETSPASNGLTPRLYLHLFASRASRELDTLPSFILMIFLDLNLISLRYVTRALG